MGVVYEAEDLNLKRHVALKFLQDSTTRTEEALERFRREAQSASALNHPNICTVYEIGEHEGHPFIAMELMTGRTLKSMIDGQPLPLDQVLEFGIQIADSLDAAHSQQIIHRDIKPGNIFITERGQVKIVDFGLAKRAEKAETIMGDGETPTVSIQTHLTKTGSLMGTVSYMSPEQARGKEMDARTDLYSFGVVLYEMSTGAPPFGEGTAGEILEALFTRKPVSPQSLNRKIPRELAEIIAKAMEKDRNLRYQSASEIRADLQRLRRDTEQLSMRSDLGLSLSRRPFRNVWITAAALSVIVALALLFYVRHDLIRPQNPSASVRKERISIAVLPFADLSSNKDQEYFSDGLTEELLNQLAKNPNLQVISRTSSFSFKNQTVDVKSIAKRLNVTHVLEGSVRKSENQLRISAQLIEAKTDTQLWSQTYDREISNIFAIQDDIASSVAGALQVKLSGGSIPKEPHTSVEAYNAYLEGSYFHSRYTKEDLEKAVQYFEKALALDPNYARAWIGLAWVHSAQGDAGYVPLDDAYELAKSEVNKGLKLNPNLAEGYAALGWIKGGYDWDWVGADAACRKARELEPGRASVNGNAATLSAALGRIEEALELDRLAINLDPLSTTIRYNHGNHASRAGKWEEARKAFQKVLELNAQYPGARMALARVLLEEKKFDEALTVIEQEPHEFWRIYGQALVYHALGRQKEADAFLAQIVKDRQHDAAYQIAEIYAYRGDKDQAFHWLDRAYKQRDSGLIELKGDSLLVSLVSDPRWNVFLKKVKLPED